MKISFAIPALISLTLVACKAPTETKSPAPKDISSTTSSWVVCDPSAIVPTSGETYTVEPSSSLPIIGLTDLAGMSTKPNVACYVNGDDYKFRISDTSKEAYETLVWKSPGLMEAGNYSISIAFSAAEGKPMPLFRVRAFTTPETRYDINLNPSTGEAIIRGDVMNVASSIDDDIVTMSGDFVIPSASKVQFVIFPSAGQKSNQYSLDGVGAIDVTALMIKSKL